MLIRIKFIKSYVSWIYGFQSPGATRKEILNVL